MGETHVRDLFARPYDTFDRYHQAKETLVWLAASTYLVLVAGALAFLFTHSDLWAQYEHYRWGIAEALFLVSLSSTCFAWRQNTFKVRAVVTQNALDRLLPRFGTKDEPTGVELHKAVRAWEELSRGRKFEESRCSGWPGWWLIGLMVAFTISVPVLVILWDP